MKLSRIFVLCSFVALGSFLFTGCTGGDEIVTPKIEKDTEGKHVHDHGHHGPHDGHVIELGDEKYHAELVHDDAAHKVTVYILDGSVKNAVPIEATELIINLKADGKPMQFKLPAVPMDGETAGKSSRFELVSEELLHEMEEQGAEPRLSFMIGEEQFMGNIEIDEHEHEGHDDDHDHGDKDEDHDHDDKDDHDEKHEDDK